MKKIIITLDERALFQNRVNKQQALIIPKKSLGQNICKFLSAEVIYEVLGEKPKYIPKPRDIEKRKASQKIYNQRADVKEKRRKYQKEYGKREYVKEKRRKYKKEYNQREDVKERKRKYQIEYVKRKKEKQNNGN